MPVVTGLTLTESARTGAYQLTSYALRGGGTAVRPPGATTFRRLPWTSVSVSPTGRIAVVDTTDAAPGTRIGIIDSLAAGTIRWVRAAVPVLDPAWSPDGRKVLVTMFDRPTVQSLRGGFEVLDPTDWSIMQGSFEAPDPSEFGSFGLHLGWDPGGDSVVGTVELPDDYSGIPKFVDTKSGETIATPPSPSQIVYGWVDEGHLVTEGTGGLVLLAMDGSTQPYAPRVGNTAVVGRADITHVGA